MVQNQTAWRKPWGWAATDEHASRSHTKMGQRATPSAVMGGELVASLKKWFVYQVGQVVCRLLNHS
jgi:hypothetical protein